MSRLFAIARKIEQIADHFRVDVPPSCDVPTETIEGSAGLVIIERDGVRLLKSLTWDSASHIRDAPQR